MFVKTTKNLFYGMVAIVFLAITTNCSAPSPDKNTEALLDAQAKLERDLAMYEDTWTRFVKGDTTVINEDRFQKDVVVVTDEGDLVGIKACKNFYMNYLTGFSDREFTIIDALGQGDRLVKHWNFKGTHDGDFFGIPATGKKVDLYGTTLILMENGKIKQEQDFFDNLDFYTQLGLMD